MENKARDNEPVTFNVIEEKAKVEKKLVERGKVRVIKKVVTEDEKVKVDVKNEEVHVERVAINEYTDTAPEVRYEGDTTIIPVIKEVAVVQKKILVVEEIRITKKTLTTEEERTVALKKEKITVESSRRKL
jgi:uncharacterized protein (TIGR02271 family)